MTLLVQSVDSPYNGVHVHLIGYHRKSDSDVLLLVRQEKEPHILEIPASHTNFIEFPDVEETEEQKFTAEKLLDAVRIISTLRSKLSDDN